MFRDGERVYGTRRLLQQRAERHQHQHHDNEVHDVLVYEHHSEWAPRPLAQPSWVAREGQPVRHLRVHLLGYEYCDFDGDYGKGGRASHQPLQEQHGIPFPGCREAIPVRRHLPRGAGT